MDTEAPPVENILEEVTKWPRLISGVFGLWPFSIRNHLLTFHWRSKGLLWSFAILVVTVLTTAAIPLLMSFGFNRLFNVDQRRKTERFGHTLMSMLRIIGSCILIITNILQKGRVMALWNDLNHTTSAIFTESTRIDSGLRAKIRRIEQRAYRKSKWLTIFMMIISSLQATVALSYSTKVSKFVGNRAAAVIGTITTIRTLGNPAFCYLLILLISVIDVMAVAFKVLSLQLSSVSSDVLSPGNGERVPVKSSDVFELARKLGGDLERIAARMNKKLQVQLIIPVGVLAIGVTFMTYFAAVSMRGGNFGIENSGAEILIHGILLYNLCQSGESLTTQVQVYGQAVGRFRDFYAPNSFHPQAQLDSLRLKLMPTVVSPGNFFTINNRLLSTIAAALVTYLIVLLQFDHNEAALKERYFDCLRVNCSLPS